MAFDLMAGDALMQRWRGCPIRYAERMSGGKWLPYRHLVYAMRIIHDAVRKGGARILLSMPPRHGKSETFSFWYPTWFLDTFPDRRVMVVSYADRLARRFSRRVRDMLGGSPISLTEDLSKGAEDEWVTHQGGGMMSSGVQGGQTGHGFDLGIVDDPTKNWMQAQSATHRQQLKDWWGSTFLTRAEPGASIIVTLTRWHEEDLAGFLESTSEEWTVINLPALALPGDPLGRAPGEALCPWRYDREALLRRKANINSDTIWECLFQGRPRAASGKILTPSRINTWYELPPIDELIQSWDLSFGSTRKSASFVVGQVWGVDTETGDYYLIDQVRGQWTLPRTIEAMRAMRDAFPSTTMTLLENKANGPAVLQTIGEELINVIPVEPRLWGDKVARASVLSVELERGKIWMPPVEAAPWRAELEGEWDLFPNADHDDQVDTASQVVCYLQGEEAVPTVWDYYEEMAA